MKIASFSKYCEHGPSSRYRIYQFADSFREAGIDFRIHPLFEDPYFEILRQKTALSRLLLKLNYVPGRFLKRKQEIRNTEADLIHIEQQLFPYLPFSWEKRFLPDRYVLEFDDAIFLTHPSKFPQVVRHASAVIAGNQFLSDYAARHNPNVYLIPTVLDTDHFRPQKKSAGSPVKIGWSGLEYNFKYLKRIAGPLLRLTQKYPVEIVIVSGSPPAGLSFPFRFQKWDPLSEVQQICNFDIGIMPLEFNDWCKGKCGFKLLQYMSLEIPSVSTPVGVNGEIVAHGENGFAASSGEQWFSFLQELVESADLREKMGKAARETVVRKYSTKQWFPEILKIYRRLA